ncbi:MAG: hypothetical protein Kow0022_04300 [Phycisphaerales bacterium]
MRHSRHGLTLVETVLSTIVVSVLLSGALTAAVSSRSVLAAADERALALQLADELMQEILQQAYVDPQTPTAPPGPDAGETSRADFDDVDDYADWTSTPATQRDGTLIPGGEHVTQRVSLISMDKAALIPKAAMSTDFTVVRVEIVRNSKLLCRLDALRTDVRKGVGP